MSGAVRVKRVREPGVKRKGSSVCGSRVWNVRQLAVEKSGGMQRIRIRIQTQEGSGGKAEKIWKNNS